MLSQIPRVIEIARLQVGVGRRDVGRGGFAENVGGDIRNRVIGDFMDEADILVFADITREITSRLVISGSATASRPRLP
jgi:hypothetical protein